MIENPVSLDGVRIKKCEVHPLEETMGFTITCVARMTPQLAQQMGAIHLLYVVDQPKADETPEDGKLFNTDVQAVPRRFKETKLEKEYTNLRVRFAEPDLRAEVELLSKKVDSFVVSRVDDGKLDVGFKVKGEGEVYEVLSYMDRLHLGTGIAILTPTEAPNGAQETLQMEPAEEDDSEDSEEEGELEPVGVGDAGDELI